MSMPKSLLSRFVLLSPGLATLLVPIAMVISVASAQTSAESGSESVAPEGKSGSKIRQIFESWFPGSDEEEGDGMPAAMEFGASPAVTPAEILSEQDLKGALPWQSPNYQSQKGHLGWSPQVFAVPDGLKGRVGFWKDIYSKYSTDQGVLHDLENVEIVYTAVDFTPIMQDPTKNPYQKARLREKLVDTKRAEVMARLRSLHGRTSASGLSGDDLKYWKLYESNRDPNKFLVASEKRRVRFQLGQRDKFIRGIFYSGRYLREMEKIFRDERLPVELTRLPFVESSFDISARSKVGASGIWQFMRRTAKPYMKVNRDIDERNDPLKATRASARLLKQNYQMLQSWPLAVTGYNHGAYGVRSIVNKLGTRDLPQIIRTYSSRTFGFASENFYACFLAAVDVEREARKHFGDVKWSRETELGELKVARPMTWNNLREFFDNDERATALANPHFLQRIRKGKANIPFGTFIRVPGSRQQVAQRFMRGQVSVAKLATALKETPILDRAPVPSEQPVVVQPVAQVAPPASTPPQVSALNASGANPASTSAMPAKGVPNQAVTYAAASGPRTHKVRPGDNLIGIAQKYGVDLEDLRKLNNISAKGRRKKRDRVQIGQVLKIPSAESEGPAGSTAQNSEDKTDATGANSALQAAPQNSAGVEGANSSADETAADLESQREPDSISIEEETLQEPADTTTSPDEE